MSVEDDSAIPYVLPIKRSDSTAFVKLRRAGSLAAAKAVREVTATAAKQHWISARMKERENDFVNWDTAKYVPFPESKEERKKRGLFCIKYICRHLECARKSANGKHGKMDR